MQVQFNSFRCFKNTDLIPVRPITLLVGENSSGKTSFQAGLHFMLSLSAFNPVSFNSPPFQLGGFNDISFSTVGRHGSRAASFSLRVRLDPEDFEPNRFDHLKGQPLPIDYKMTFSEWLAQPALDHFLLESGQRRMNVDLLRRTVEFSIEQRVIGSLKLSNELYTHLSTIRHIPSAIGSLIASLQSVGYLEKIPESVGTLEGGRPLNRKAISQFRPILQVAANLFFGGGLSANLFAFAPIRSEPKRTYDILEDATGTNPSGGHVPLALAQAKLRDEARWKSSKEYLVKFGRSSGLFKNIDIRRTGSSQTDPFQILLSVGGNKHNIVDVGYGVSQVIPLLYEMAPSRQSKLLFLQQPEVHLHPRAQAQLGVAIVESYKASGHKYVVETHSDFIIDRVRNAIRLGQIRHSDVSILYFERISSSTNISSIELDDGGNVVNPPDNYRSFFFREERDLLGI